MNESGGKPALRGWLIAAAVAFAIAMPILQAFGLLGLAPAEFAEDGNETLRAAGYAFMIWNVIYAGLIGFAIYQFWPPRPRGAALEALAFPALIAILGCGVWIIASAQDAKLATVIIITVCAFSATAGLLRASPQPLVRGEWSGAILPISLLGGWLTIATAINAITVATAWGWITEASAAAASAVGIALVAAIGAWITTRPRLAMFGVPIAWGLVAVAVAMWSQRPGIAWMAAGAALVMLGAIALGWRKLGLPGKPA